MNQHSVSDGAFGVFSYHSSGIGLSVCQKLCSASIGPRRHRGWIRTPENATSNTYYPDEKPYLSYLTRSDSISVPAWRTLKVLAPRSTSGYVTTKFDLFAILSRSDFDS